MARVYLFEDHRYAGFCPLIYWRTVFELLCGRRTLMDRIAYCLKEPIACLWTREWMAGLAAQHCQMPVNNPAESGTVLINGRWLADGPLEHQAAPFVGRCGDDVVYVACDDALAAKLSPEVMLDEDRAREVLDGLPCEDVEARMVRYPWDLLARNSELLEDDWMSCAHGIEGTISSSAIIVDLARVSVGHGAVIKPTACLDATTGPVHISYNATVESHVTIQGPAYIGPCSVVKPHTYLYGGTSVGPFCKVGGEIDGSIFCGYSNKQHEGFLGHSYLGSWVNIGADTANSDLKNTYGTVRMRIGRETLDTGQRFLGTVIGDHSKIGISQAIPTGASIGFAVNTFTSSILPTFLPSLSWLTDDGMATGDPQRLLETARTVMGRRNVALCSNVEGLFSRIRELTQELEGAPPSA
ncbi:MAG: hypothetical protein GY842_02710 [bacterium]|nr:hypothetical protein [bacterium]